MYIEPRQKGGSCIEFSQKKTSNRNRPSWSSSPLGRPCRSGTVTTPSPVTTSASENATSGPTGCLFIAWMVTLSSFSCSVPVRIPICLISRFKAAPPRGCFLFCPATTGSGDRSASWANMARKKRPCPDGQRRLRDLVVAVLSLRRQDT